MQRVILSVGLAAAGFAGLAASGIYLGLLIADALIAGGHCG